MTPNIHHYRLVLLVMFSATLATILVLNGFMGYSVVADHSLAKDVCHNRQSVDDNQDIDYIVKETYSSSGWSGMDSRYRFANISDNVFIYSAFETNDNFVVLIGLAKNEWVNEEFNYYHYNYSYRSENYRYLCGFNGLSVVNSEAVIEYIKESHGYYYSAVKIKCRKPKLYDQKWPINKVKVIETDYKTRIKTFESEFIEILKTDNKSQVTADAIGDQKVVVCVRPLFGNVSLIRLLEFIAYYRLNSIDKIVFYHSFDETMISDVRQTLQVLSSMPFVNLMPLVIPQNNYKRKIIHEWGQLTANHDCLYRFANYIQIHVDFDEYLKPNDRFNTVKEFLLSPEVSIWSALVVPSVIFCHEFNHFVDNTSSPLLINYYNRQKTVWPHELRSKVIVMRAKFVAQLGIHNIWRLFNSHSRSHPIKYLDPNQMVVHHYRKCCYLIQPYFKTFFPNYLYFNTANDYIVRDKS
ncbi:uncharacterized protein LOC128961200 [Oppia nitens]|uniref:uncharacterized protein LOC128961200 n=1 Tax=Oppia nitens TaxID=1686743 RepID=UPI0023DC5B8F|nr:uncharacterized protein LOC128961200 [Oppia nitens]